jgi:pimeloyl-ACP methyl ester carboxylesterase
MTNAGPTSRTFFSQRLRLHYVDWGNPEGPPLILVHGTRDHCRNWDWVAERLKHKWHIIAPDLRGHGDSQWSAEGSYAQSTYVYDLAQLIHQLKLDPVTLVGHSLGGSIVVRYTGIYPDRVRRLVAIEGLGLAPRLVAERAATPVAKRLGKWIEDVRGLAGRAPKRYASLDEALNRMREENKHLSEAQARHLTVHGVNQNEDGTFSWKFDNDLRVWPPADITQAELESLWAAIACPTLLVYGKESWASNPLEDGRARHFKSAEVLSVAGAGHWVHHDKLDEFMAALERFL